MVSHLNMQTSIQEDNQHHFCEKWDKLNNEISVWAHAQQNALFLFELTTTMKVPIFFMYTTIIA